MWIASKRIVLVLMALWVGQASATKPAWSLSQLNFPEAAFTTHVLEQDMQWSRRRLGTSSHRECIILSGPRGYAAIDRATGTLVRVFRTDIVDEAVKSNPIVTLDEAHWSARAFLSRVGIQVAAPWVNVQAKYFDHGGYREYRFSWLKFHHGVELPAMLDVGVDAESGKVQSYTFIDDPVVIPVQSRITADEAIRLVARRQGYQRYVVKQAHPMIAYQPQWPGPQALLWEVEMTNPDAQVLSESQVTARVNAMTGEIVQRVVPMSSAPVNPVARPRMDEEPKEKASPFPKVDLEAAAKDKVPPTLFERMEQGKPKERPAAPGGGSGS